MDLPINQAAVELIDKLGGLTAVASAAGVSRQAVFKWRKHGIPPARVEALKRAFPRGGWGARKSAIGRGKFGPRK